MGQRGRLRVLVWPALAALVVTRARASRRDAAAFLGTWLLLALRPRRSGWASRSRSRSTGSRAAALAPLRVLHDLGPEARRPIRARAASSSAALVAAGACVHPVPPLPHQRPALVARRLLALRAFDRPLVLPGRCCHSLERRPPCGASRISSPLPCSCSPCRAPALAFCGFYVAKADAKLFNRASQVAIVRDGDRTVLTMANDFQGDPKEFAIVVPVPTVLSKRADPRRRPGAPRPPRRLLLAAAGRVLRPRPLPALETDRAVDVSAAPQKSAAELQVGHGQEPRRHDRGPLHRRRVRHPDPLGARVERPRDVAPAERLSDSRMAPSSVLAQLHPPEHALLRREGEPGGAGAPRLSATCAPSRSPTSRRSSCCPCAWARSTRDGPQELFVYMLTRKGRVETTNYRTVRLPSDLEVPVYVKDEFPAFYKALFTEQVRRERMHSVFLEYAWDMNWCDPCASAPLSPRRAARARRLLARRAVAGPGSERLPDTAPRPVRRRALSRRPGLPGDGRPDELPGPLRPAPCLRRRADLLGHAVPRRSAQAPREGGPDAGGADGLALRRDPPQDEPRRRVGGRAQVVGETLEPMTSRAPAGRPAGA